MAKTAKFDGHAAKLFGSLAQCPDKDLPRRYRQLCGMLGSQHGASHLIRRQSGKQAKRVIQRLEAHDLL